MVDAIFNGKRTTIDPAGRVVIPKRVRKQAGLRPGVPLEVRWQDGRIVIEPEPTPVRVVQRGRFTVAIPESAIGEQLDEDAVEATREALRRERNSGEE